MLTDENPAEWHTDAYIKAWHLARFRAYPKTLVPLISVRGPMTAEIDFTKPGAPVTRMMDTTPNAPDQARRQASPGAQSSATPTSCGYCEYEESDGSLWKQCAKCAATDSANLERG